ncbi:MAG: type II toxin-antitoxin system RelE/ParE family toxin [Bdellovibrionaceae bacterium]|nr:type II toxin-antitoxin system RelE/ParE family toxin [Bdellovibrionales bacterium]MCB9086693.1 type II toxin-antitoxin system RelE/ParE family toxin [Pseudobdellovibrionaceae bacterium]
MQGKSIEYYITEAGQAPFLDWFDKLPHQEQYIVRKYLLRIADGGSKKSLKSLKGGVFEIRIFHGSGLRVYFAEDGEKIILLLLGGNKRSQKSDIGKARKYWSEYAKTK